MQLPSLHRVDGKTIAYDTHLQAAGLDIDRNGVAGFIFLQMGLACASCASSPFCLAFFAIAVRKANSQGNGLDNSIISIYNYD